MKRTALAVVLLAGILLAAGCTTGRYAQYERPHRAIPDTLSTMKTQDVIALSKAGISDSLIVTMLDVSGSWFNLKTQDVLDLKNAGVSDRVINAMIATNAPSANRNRNADKEYAYAYPPYYWYTGFYPSWYYPSGYYPYGYYPSPYLGFRFNHRPAVIHRYVYPNRFYGATPGGRSWGRGGGGRRR